MKVQKIQTKAAGAEGVTVEWVTAGLGPEGDATVEHRLKGHSRPHPDFVNLWNGAAVEVIRLLGFVLESRDENDDPIEGTGESAAAWELRTIRFGEAGEDTDTVAFSLVRQIEGSNRPLPINTPVFELRDNGAVRPSFRRLLSDLRKEAGSYAKGKGEQGELDLGMAHASTGGIAAAVG